MTSPQVRPATVADRARVAETVAAAFVDDPVFRHLFPDQERFAEQAGSFAGSLFDTRVDQGTVWLVEDGRALAMWEPPSPQGHAGERAVLDLPPGPLARVHAYESAVAEIMPTDEHWYLGVLATHPDHAGQRLGRVAMRQGLDAAARAGLPAYLETASDANVALYLRSGWSVVAEATVGPLHVRVMAHPAPSGQR
jgi:GNAT superfamily N-acetyltransferase